MQDDDVLIGDEAYPPLEEWFTKGRVQNNPDLYTDAEFRSQVVKRVALLRDPAFLNRRLVPDDSLGRDEWWDWEPEQRQLWADLAADIIEGICQPYDGHELCSTIKHLRHRAREIGETAKV